MSRSVARHRTAIGRSGTSRPIRLALEDALIRVDTTVFDYGCGRGDDLRNLCQRGIKAAGWDPVHQPFQPRITADVVNLGYVINVIEDAAERVAALRAAWDLTRKLLIVAARLRMDARDTRGTTYEDGCITRLRTFQKYYHQQELREWIDKSLQVSAIPAGPGVFYVFRDPALRQSFLASRYRRPIATPKPRKNESLFDQHRALLDPLIAFITARARLPDLDELDVAPAICRELGSLGRAHAVVRRVMDTTEWDRVRQQRVEDRLVYLALARFHGRPRFKELPRDLQLDVSAFFSSYQGACFQADELLFSAGRQDAIDSACEAATVGKLTRTDLYVHVSALSELPPILRVYEGCARAYIGVVEAGNIIKLHRHKPQVSYLAYPAFERHAHPALLGALVVPLQTFQAKYLDFADSANPPILHRKDEFLAPSHPLRAKFARLTKQEERLGLFARPELIGTLEGWRKVLQGAGVTLAGHRILRKNMPSTAID